jgi:aryl sulfotransferase
VTAPRTVWLASYPKSGSTWIRAMLAAVTADGGASRLDLDSLGGGPVPSSRPQIESFLGFASSDLTEEELERLRPLCDAAFDRDLGELRFRKVHDTLYGTLGAPIVPPEHTRGAVYVVRDPRDVAVSWAHHSARTHEWAVAALADPATAMNESPTDLEPQTLQRLGTWSDHVAAWIDHGLFPTIVVRYEDLAADPAGELRRIAGFAGLEAEEERLGAAARAAAFERLRAHERRHGFMERPGRDRPFFRRGVAGAWRDELDPALAARVERDHRAAMQRLGYAG